MEEAACITLETYYYTIKRVVDLVLVYPEQMFEKLERYINRIVTVTLFEIIEYGNILRKQLIRLQNYIVNGSTYKKIMRVCNDLYRCEKFIELIIPACGGTQEDIKKFRDDVAHYQKLICQNDWTKLTLEILDTLTTIANSYLAIVKTAISYYLGMFFDYLIAKYHQVLDLLRITYLGKVYTIKQLLDDIDSLAQCVFGLCSIGATATNWSSDVRNRLGINKNGRFKKTEFLKGFNKDLNKGLNGILSLEIAVQSSTNIKNYFNDKTNFSKKVKTLNKTIVNSVKETSLPYATKEKWKSIFQTDKILNVK